VSLLLLQLLAVVGLFVRAWHDYLTAPRLPPASNNILEPTNDSRPEVVVLVPARDEEHNIVQCLGALCDSHAVRFEVIVIDDGSVDRTAEIVRAFAARDGRVRLMSAASRPHDWCGKSWALTQGIAAANADAAYLCFVDADVRLAPMTLARALSHARRHDCAMVSLLPALTTVTFWESVVQPVMGLMIFLFQPLRAVNSPSARVAVANGQFLLVRRSDYDAVGGHGAIRGEIVEDVALARAMKEARLRVALVPAPDAMATRMYDGLASLWEGWGKTLHPYLKREPLRIWLGAWFFIALLVAPFIALAMPLDGALWLVNLATVATILGNVIVFRALMGQPLRHALLWPLGCAVLLALLATRTAGVWAGWPVRWKSRSYT
jgi:glycosyltransferase involved in cell wall biosynthesis